MASKNEIKERINFYSKKVADYEKTGKFPDRLKTTKGLLSFWENQLIQYEKCNEKQARP